MAGAAAPVAIPREFVASERSERLAAATPLRWSSLERLAGRGMAKPRRQPWAQPRPVVVAAKLLQAEEEQRSGGAERAPQIRAGSCYR